MNLWSTSVKPVDMSKKPSPPATLPTKDVSQEFVQDFDDMLDIKDDSEEKGSEPVLPSHAPLPPTKDAHTELVKEYLALHPNLQLDVLRLLWRPREHLHLRDSVIKSLGTSANKASSLPRSQITCHSLILRRTSGL